MTISSQCTWEWYKLHIVGSKAVHEYAHICSFAKKKKKSMRIFVCAHDICVSLWSNDDLVPKTTEHMSRRPVRLAQNIHTAVLNTNDILVLEVDVIFCTTGYRDLLMLLSFRQRCVCICAVRSSSGGRNRTDWRCHARTVPNSPKRISSVHTPNNIPKSDDMD